MNFDTGGRVLTPIAELLLEMIEPKGRTLLFRVEYTFKNATDEMNVTHWKTQLFKGFIYESIAIMAVIIQSSLERGTMAQYDPETDQLIAMDGNTISPEEAAKKGIRVAGATLAPVDPSTTNMKVVKEESPKKVKKVLKKKTKQPKAI